MKILNNKKMKTRFISYLVLLGVFVITYSCTDLDEVLIGEITADVSTTGVSTGGGGDASDVLAGPFSTLRNGTANHGGYFSVQEVSSDAMAVTQKGGDWYDGGVWLDIHRHTYTGANGPLNGAWGQLYGGVNECNTQLASAGISPNQQAQLKALRAYYYFRLLDLYGRVKLVTTPGSDAPQSDRVTVFNFVESELLATLGISAVTSGMDLSASNLTAADDKYRINKYAALGILAKLYLNAEVYTGVAKYQEAYYAADYIITNSPYILCDEGCSVPNLGMRPGTDDPENLVGYAAIFGANNESNPEIIWSVAYDEVTGGGMNFHHMTLHYSSQFTYNFTSQPWNGYVALEEFYNSYDDNDKRKANNFIVGVQLDYGGSTIVDYSDPGDPVLNYTTFVNELEPNAQRDGGARLGKFSFQQFARNDLNNDYPIVRLGDIYLIRGEANARQSGSWANALSDVNAIRSRAGIASLSSVDADEFLAERGREMFMETTRRRDLIRFGKWGDAWWEKAGGQASYLEIMPIPIEQITASGGTLTQNTGY
ncbi:MAG: RagB/SusD family nutrient uptake outer membrane protein [Lutibacter sp.]|nr:MAG: RagB/SusD family nutrient uptake outer membrane protein [Lutibacter sp.]